MYFTITSIGLILWDTETNYGENPDALIIMGTQTVIRNLKPELLSYNGVMVMEMDTAIWVQILDENDCISHSTNTLGKGMNPIILPPVRGK